MSSCDYWFDDAHQVTLDAQRADFGQTAVRTTSRRIVVTLTNKTSTDVGVTPTLRGTPGFTFVPEVSCGSTLAANSMCSMVAEFSPIYSGPQSATLRVAVTIGALTTMHDVELAGTGIVLAPGQGLVTATNNPLVALYAYSPPAEGTISVEFGTDTNYGRTTWAQRSSNDGSPVVFQVAGMRSNTAYHLRASLETANGNVIKDDDHAFTTGNFNPESLPGTKVARADGLTPQPGIELVDASSGPSTNYLQAYATDLEGNLIWGYDYPDRLVNSDYGTIVQPIKPLSNGHFLVVLSYASQNASSSGPAPPGTINLIREIDLAGNPIRQLTIAELNAKLARAGYNVALEDFHHDITVLPNGHWIALASTIRQFSNLGGPAAVTNVLGDALVDLDADLNPVWVWNAFDHLDINRQPLGFPDWTHTNAVLYSKNDGNLLISMRHQHWIIKVDYENGSGSGTVLWRLGLGGDFALVNGTDPVDWFYGQHLPSFITESTARSFSLAVMDNGNSRLISPGVNCGVSAPCYSTIPVYAIDEVARTATLTFRQVFPSDAYSDWGGGTTALPNGHLEFDLCTQPNIAQGTAASLVQEVVPDDTHQVVWAMEVTGANAYRANRIPSLYPGVQW